MRCEAAKGSAPSEAVTARAKASYNQGLNLENRAEWRAALNAFLTTVTVQPKLASAWAELGKCYANLHDYKHAEHCFRFALTMALDKEDLNSCLSGLMHCEWKNGELEEVQQTRREYVAKFPKAPDVKRVMDEIKYYDQDFATTRETEKGSYPRHYLFRSWINSGMPKMPITVSISASKLSRINKSYKKAISTRYQDLAKRAFLLWSSATGGTLVFDFIANPADAQINCEWTNNLKERGNSFEAGHCDTIRSGSLRTEKQRPLIFVGSNLTETDTSFYNICVHEIGHALGLMHSSNPQDVMYSMGGPQDAHQFAVLSKQDINRVRTIYTNPGRAAQLALNFGTAAFLEHDYETAYSLLSETEKKNLSMEQFERELEKQDVGPRPDSIVIDCLQGDLHYNRTNFIVLGRNQKNERSYYLIQTVQLPDGSFKINKASRDPY